MRNLFTALKQDTHANHSILENTFPFSIYHNNNSFDDAAYNAILQIMKLFHQATAEAVQHAADHAPLLSRVSAMINSKAVLNALNTDIQALNDDTHAPAAACSPIQAISEDTHPSSVTIPSCSSPSSQAIAAIYVWLGSSMGANIIVRRLNAMERSIPTNYYQAMAGCAKAWVSFKQEVDALLPELAESSESLIEAIVEDANAWFEYLISLAEAVGHDKNLRLA
ncbi:biliverdin-producing heme oxygenase [Alteromonas portus]|uniref:Biliverdin-producing heme oxygenase n=1 Tax=Alteromonas portus TaxID=2565549 RepID=A0A4V5NNV5_9ALTE|nr:biliverdin-producing heme oxygenase [Alteromonas portus]TKB04186.1 biliverdin-producing heme oxygenase [Alteromonas portus]